MHFVILFFLFWDTRGSIICDPVPGTPVNNPIGIGKGVFPGRVIWAFDPKSTSWSGNLSQNWWEFVDQDIVDKMFVKTILLLSKKKSAQEAWKDIFEYFNFNKHGIKNRGYKTGEKIAVKINLCGNFRYYVDNYGNQASPQFLKSLVSHLVHIVGVKDDDITIYDSSRLMSHYYIDRPYGLLKDFPNLRFVDNVGGIFGTEKTQVDFSSAVYFSNHSVPAWNRTYLPKCSSEADYLIVLNDFRGNEAGGITMSGKNFFGNIYRSDVICKWQGIIDTHFCPTSLHEFVNCTINPMGKYNPLVDLLGHPKLGGNGLLFLSDALYAGPENIKRVDGELYPQEPVRFYSSPFNGHWSSSIFASQDPIALDSVAFDIMRNEPSVPLAHVDVGGCIDNYLHESALADNPPSGTAYNPSGTKRLESLGVHEHWNNEQDKKYSGNLGKQGGITLVIV